MIFTVNCSYQLCLDTSDKKLKKCCNIKSIILCSYDLFGPITKAIRAELYNNRINVLNNLNYDVKEQDVCIYLHIINASENHITTSIFPDGTEAGYQLMLHIHAKLLVSNTNYYPINIQVHRNFINNYQNALFNKIQENDVRKLMYQEAAEKIIFYINCQ